jgi:hypothetical protein
LLGSFAVLLGLGAGYIIFEVGYVDETAVAILVAGLLLGGLVVGEAITSRQNRVELTAEQICLNEACVSWESVTAVQEKHVHRFLKTWFGRVHLRHIRQLLIHTSQTTAPLLISNEWLTAADYAAVRARLEAHTAITVVPIEEEG